MDRIIELLASVTEDSTIEEARRVIADCIDEAQKVKDDITGLKQSIDEINAVNADLTDEVARLKEENGRLYRDRVRTVTEAVKGISAEKTAASDAPMRTTAAESTPSPLLHIDDSCGQEMAINTIKSLPAGDKCYNLLGMQVPLSTTGIVIIPCVGVRINSQL